jgi:hypothetical protein
MDYVYGVEAEQGDLIRTFYGGLLSLTFVEGEKLGVLEDDPKLLDKFPSACGRDFACKLIGKPMSC